MPSNVVHNYFAKEVLKKLNAPIKELINNNLEAYLVGSQGPDLLFYLRFEDEPINELGQMVHNSFNGYQMFKASFDYAKERDSDTIKAFIFGQLCHYALDASLHPYIFHREKDLVKHYHKDAHKHIHVVYESALDYLWIRDYIGKNPAFYKGNKNLKLSKKAKAEIGEYYSEVVAPMFGMELSPKKGAKTIKLMRLYLRLCDDTTGLKYLLIRLIEKWYGQSRSVSAFIRPRRERKEEDWLNLTRTPYPKYHGEEIIESKTVEEIVEDALEEARQLVEGGYNYMSKNEEELSSALFYRNYSGERNPERELIEPALDLDEA